MNSIKNDYLNLDNLNNYSSIFSLSFILTGNYVFWSNSFLYKPLFNILIESLFLLIFSFILIILVIKIFSFFSKVNLNKEIILFLELIFFCWLITQAIKGFFFLANAETLPQFISSTFSLVTRGDVELQNRIVIFTIPYFLVFISLFLVRNNLNKVIRMCVSIGYIFLITSLFIFYERYTSFASKPIKVSQNIDLKYINKDKKVIWFVFDGFDPLIAFDNEELSPDLNTFSNLRKSSFEHKNAYPPSKYTSVSMPSMLIGEHPIGSNVIKNYKIHLNTNSGLIPFDFENTIFGQFKKLGLTSAIFSNVFPYCVFMPEVNNCLSPTDQDDSPPEYFWYNGISFIYSIKNKFDLFSRLINKKKNLEKMEKNKNKLKYEYVSDINILKKISPKIDMEKLDFFDGRDCCKEAFSYSDIKFHMENLDKNLTFIHLFPPHTTGENNDFAESVYEVSTTLDGRAKGLGSYILNLKLTDLLLNKILKNLKEKDKKDLMIILSSDHWYRDKDKRTRRSYPALFIVKIYGDNSKLVMTKNSSLYNVKDLIMNFFENRISSHSEIKDFFERKDFFKTFVLN